MTAPEMIPVDSSSVERVGHDADQQELHVQFHDGSTYVYSNVDDETFQELRQAASVGSYFNRVIKPSHSYQKL
jgi:hypothetical protein